MLIYRVLACTIMLLYGSYRDIKAREVEDKPWIIFGALGTSFNIYEWFIGEFDLTLSVISIIVTGGLAFTLYYFGFYGGADAKALFVLALLLPICRPQNHLHPLAGIMVLSNGVILTLGLPLYFGLLNLIRLARRQMIFKGFEQEPAWKKILACLLGYRVGSSLRPFLLSLEKNVEGRRVFSFSLFGLDDEFERRIDVWVTPGLPLLIFLSAGFAVTIAYGDLLVPIFNFFKGFAS